MTGRRRVPGDRVWKAANRALDRQIARFIDSQSLTAHQAQRMRKLLTPVLRADLLVGQPEAKDKS